MVAFYLLILYPGYFSNNNNLSFYFFRLPYLIGIISALLIILAKKAILKEFIPSGDAIHQRTWLYFSTHVLLAFISSSFGWLLANTIIRILSLLE